MVLGILWTIVVILLVLWLLGLVLSVGEFNPYIAVHRYSGGTDKSYPGAATSITASAGRKQI